MTAIRAIGYRDSITPDAPYLLQISTVRPSPLTGMLQCVHCETLAFADKAAAMAHAKRIGATFTV